MLHNGLIDMAFLYQVASVIFVCQFNFILLYYFADTYPKRLTRRPKQSPFGFIKQKKMDLIGTGDPVKVIEIEPAVFPEIAARL